VTTDLNRRIWDSFESGMLWFDTELRIVDANRAAREVLGLGDGPLAARIDDLGWKQSDEHLVPMPDEARPVWRAIHGAGETTEGIVVVETAHRGQRWLRARAVPVESLGGDRGPGAIVSFTDFTDQRRAARSLLESEQLFRMFGEHALDLIWIVDPRTQKLLYMNPAYERIWGRPRAPLFEDLAHWLDGVDPADRQRVADAALHPNAAGMYETEYRVNRPDGRVVWIRGRGFPLFDLDGRMRYMAGFAEDITPARSSEMLERAHRVAQERLERIVATAPGAVHSYRLRPDGHGEFTFASPAILDLLGVDAATLVDGNIDLLALVHPEDRPAVEESLRVSAGRGSAWLATFRVPHTRDGERCIEAHSMPVRESDGSVVWHGFLIDITERRRAEQEIRSLNVELENRVAERTSELEAKHHEMEAFTYSVSHDLKAPLRGIDGYSRLLESDHVDKLDDEGRFFVSMIRKATAQMGELIDDLLAYSRVERGRPKLGPVDPTSVVAAVVDGYASEVADDGIALNVSVEPDLSVQGEREGLVLVLRNLLDNAIKFTAGRSGRAIEIGVRREQSHALFWVRDNGPGFDMRYHDRIFEIFQRLHRSEDFPGTGVGLAIVRKAVERMHGKVWAESARDQGATFYLRLPMACVTFVSPSSVVSQKFVE
jgi:PAS domain S-box-containing protein